MENYMTLIINTGSPDGLQREEISRRFIKFIGRTNYDVMTKFIRR
jgi:hypothetical protein